MKYLFEQFELDTDKLELHHADHLVPLEPQVFALLELLITHSDRVVGKEEINERVWGGRVVSDAALNSRVRTLRMALGDSGKTQRVIKTIRERGFRFVAKLQTMPISVVVHQQTPGIHTVDTPGHAAGTQHKPSIAVLPLKLLSLDTRYEPLADAIAHELIADLSRLRWLHVISRASTFKLRSSDRVLEDAESILGVDYVLTGNLSLFGDSASITVELAKTQSGAVVWAESIQCSLAELIELRLSLTTRIANAIEIRIQTQEAQNSEFVTTENLDAWMAYFRGLRHVYRFNAYDNQIATHLFEQAVSQDPQFALAYAGLSFSQFQNAFVGYVPDVAEARQLSLQYAERAFELDQLDPVTNLMMGRAQYLNGQWQQAGPWFQRCTTLSPNNALAYYQQALMHVISGEVSDVTDLSMQAISLSPIDPLQYAFLATRSLGHLAAGDSQSAAHWGELAANSPRAHHLIDALAAIAHVVNGDQPRAEFRRQRIAERAPQFEVEHFFRSFPIEDGRVRELITSAFGTLSIE
jgi:TolB-like protein